MKSINKLTDEIGEFIDIERKKQGITIRHLAELAGVDKMTIVSVIKNYKSFKVETIEKIVRPLGFSITPIAISDFKQEEVFEVNLDLLQVVNVNYLGKKFPLIKKMFSEYKESPEKYTFYDEVLLIMLSIASSICYLTYKNKMNPKINITRTYNLESEFQDLVVSSDGESFKLKYNEAIGSRDGIIKITTDSPRLSKSVYKFLEERKNFQPEDLLSA
jgi:transcriptional regulator with XRE-family HTH domain